jgi:hypothetical protein
VSWLILNDKLDYKSMWYPTHIIGKDNQLISVFIGASSILDEKAIGLYVSDEDYNHIRHDKAYIFIHDPDVKEEDIDKVDWNKIQDVEEEKETNRDHIHIWSEIEYKGSA